MIHTITTQLEQLHGLSTVEEKIACAQGTLDAVETFTGSREKKVALLRLAAEIPATAPFLPVYRLICENIDTIEEGDERRSSLLEIVKEIPADGEFYPLYKEVVDKALGVANTIGDPKHRKSALLRIAHGIPKTPEAQPLFLRAMADTIETAARIEDRFVRSYSLVDLADELPMIADFIPLRLHALRLAIGVEEGAEYKKYSLREIAKELPQTCDYAFYRKYTLLGIAKDLPHRAEFFELYKEALQLAIDAAEYIEEPYYRKYALIYIAKELPKTDEFRPLFLNVMHHTYEVTTKIKDPFVQNYALIDLLQETPKTEEFFPLLKKVIELILSFFTVKKRMEELELVDVLDYILVAEEKKIKESTKKKYTRTKYALLVAKELNKFGKELNDIRLIEIMKPYTHRWVKPKELRFAVKRIVDHLETLRESYHGCEIEKPLLIGYTPLDDEGQVVIQKREAAVEDCLSIDLGATNTVVVRKKKGEQPESVALDAISKRYGDVYVIPTRLSPADNAIGIAATGEDVIVNFKKMLLEGKEEGMRYMATYIDLLYEQLKQQVSLPQWYSFFSGSHVDRLYVTVPVGFHGYRKTLGELIEKTKKGLKVDFLEEPLAAAIGYQVAEVRDKIVLIVDFGGSTLDLMMVRLNINGIHVVSKPDRSKILGGHDIDLWLADYLKAKLGGSVEGRVRELVEKAEELKVALSDSREVTFLWDSRNVCTVTRDDFEAILSRHNFYKTVDRALSNIFRRAEKLGVKSERIEAILLTGGSSQMPSFKDKIGSVFPVLREENAIYDHSPLSAVAMGAVQYGTRDIVDRHLGLAYALRYHTGKEDSSKAYEIVFEKGEAFPFEKSYTLIPARTLGDQNKLYLEFVEMPEAHIVRRWEEESGVEFIKQTTRITDDTALRTFKIVTLTFNEPLEESVTVTFSVDGVGRLTVGYGKNILLDTGIRLQ